MRFRILTYNIHKAIGIDRRFDPDRIIHIIKHHDADIVLLQEVDRGVPRSNHVDLASMIASAIHLEYRAVGMNVVMKKGRYGNATLSRFPIGRQRNINLTIGWRKRRGAQHTRIHVGQTDGSVLDVFNVHLGLSATERAHQIRTLLRATNITRPSDHTPCIVAGDTNDWRDVLRRHHFERAGFVSATNRRGGIGRSIKTFPSFAPTGGLDKIYYRGNLRLVSVHRSRLALAKIASDHLPVMADFETV
jgi:endonuclease/exonuclease/phosphatase family metal-dependent hydrolase